MAAQVRAHRTILHAAAFGGAARRPSCSALYAPGVRLLRERPDQVIRYLWIGMFPVAMAGVVLGYGPLIAASGVVITLVGLLLVTDFNRVLERLSERYRHSWTFRMQGKTRFTRFEGGLCLAIGLGWLALGLALSLSA
jgi:hypothetical protein